MAYYYQEPSHTFSEYLLIPGYTPEGCVPQNVSLRTALTMALAVTFVTAFSNVGVSLIRKVIPSSIRMIVEMTIIATLVILVDQLIKAHIALMPDKSLKLAEMRCNNSRCKSHIINAPGEKRNDPLPVLCHDIKSTCIDNDTLRIEDQVFNKCKRSAVRFVEPRAYSRCFHRRQV